MSLGKQQKLSKKEKLIDLSLKERKALIAAVETPQCTDTDLSLNELELLLQNLDIKAFGRFVQKRNEPDPRSFIGIGKAEELRNYAVDSGTNLLVIDDFLNPTQKSNLEKITGVEVWDRAFVIMKIFESRANTYEAKLQVKLAQYRYEIPSLKGLGLQMSRTGGGIGTRGPGETEFERHKRKLDKRVLAIIEKLEIVKRRRKLNRDRKRKYGVPLVSLVGYTNSGKSTLLRSLSNDSTIDSANQLFTTLDTVSRRINYHDLTGSFLLSDTVGFIRKLPTALIAAFRATLEEVVAANLLLVVLDVSEDEAIDHFDIVLDTLKELQADTIPRIVVLNKIDIAGDNTDMIEMELRASGEEAVRVSALAREGFISLLERIQYKLEEQSLE
jgi:GTP-binding protein HflX